MLYLSRLITFLYIKQEIWRLAFGDTHFSLTFSPLREGGGKASPGCWRRSGPWPVPLPGRPAAEPGRTRGAGPGPETGDAREPGSEPPWCVSFLAHVRAWPAKAMQCQCSDNADFGKEHSSRLRGRAAHKTAERENEGQQMKGIQRQEHIDRNTGSHASKKVKREQENPNHSDTN